MSSKSALTLSFGTLDGDESLNKSADYDILSVGELQSENCGELESTDDVDESLSLASFVDESDAASTCSSDLYELRQSFLESECEPDISVSMDEKCQHLYEGSDITLVER